MSKLLQLRLTALVNKRMITQQQARQFDELESLMESATGDSNEELLARFHDSNDSYLPLLEKVLKSLVRLGEPLAQKKLDLFLEERGSLGAAVFLAPWEMTLAYLDEDVGRVGEIEAHYS